MQNILIVEDGKDFQLIIQKALHEAANLRIVESVQEAARILASQTFDLVVLDISLPDGDGFQVCNFLQTCERNKNAPIIFLTANEDISAKVAAFALGAEDYIVKPFNPMEFRARVDAKLRKMKRLDGADKPLVQGQIKIDLLAQKAFLTTDGKDTEVTLTPLEFKILSFLARNSEKAMSREQILHAVWGSNVHVYDRTVDTHISSLRKKIAPCGHYIQAILGSGYSFSPMAKVPAKKAA